MAAVEKKKRKGNFFTSMKLSVILLLILAALFAVSTFIYGGKGQEAALAAFFKPGWFPGTELYRSSFAPVIEKLPLFLAAPVETTLALVTPFLIISALLILNILFCTIQRLTKRSINISSLLTHSSFILIMVGASIGALAGRSGFIGLRQGDHADSFIDRDTNRKVELPFMIYLDKFVVEKVDEPLRRLVIFDRDKGRETYLPVKPGEHASMNGCEVKLLEDHDATKIDRDIRDAEKGMEGITALELRISTNNGKHETAWVFYPGENQVTLLNGYINLGLWKRESLEETLNLKDRRPTLLLTTSDEETFTAETELTIGGVVKWNGTPYSARIETFLPDFRMGDNGEKISASNEPRNPALEITLFKNNVEISSKWLFSKYPDFDMTHEKSGTEKGPHIVFKYPENTDEPPVGQDGFISVIVTGKDKIFLLYKDSAGEPGTVPLPADGTPVSLPAPYDCNLAVLDFFPHAIVNDVRVPNDGGPGMPALKVAVESGKKGTFSDTLWLLPQQPVAAGNTGISLFYSFDYPVKDYMSKLFIYNRNGMITGTGKTLSLSQESFPEFDGFTIDDTLTIQVNDPFVRDGFYIYQASYDPDRPTWTGLQVKKNPGAPFLVSGFLFLMAGVIGIFYFRPIMKKHRTKQVSRDIGS